MKHRSPIAVLLLSFITLGIYSWYWLVKTKGEMNKLGEHIPTAWVWLIPIVGIIWWYWEYAKGVEHVTDEKINNILAFVVMWLLGWIGQAIIQSSFNKIIVPVEVPIASVNPPAYQPPQTNPVIEENQNFNQPQA